MNIRRRTTRSLAEKATTLAFAAPQVVAHRVTRTALPSPDAPARDCTEFARIAFEKNAAFFQSWIAIATQAAVAKR